MREWKSIWIKVFGRKEDGMRVFFEQVCRHLKDSNPSNPNMESIPHQQTHLVARKELFEKSSGLLGGRLDALVKAVVRGNLRWSSLHRHYHAEQSRGTVTRDNHVVQSRGKLAQSRVVIHALALT